MVFDEVGWLVAGSVAALDAGKFALEVDQGLAAWFGLFEVGESAVEEVVDLGNGLTGFNEALDELGEVARHECGQVTPAEPFTVVGNL